jgi:hypothetical protein
MQADDRFSQLYRHVLKPIFSRFGIPDEEQKYWLVYHINGLMAIVTEWLKGDCSETVEDIAKIIEKCVIARMGS